MTTLDLDNIKTTSLTVHGIDGMIPEKLVLESRHILVVVLVFIDNIHNVNKYKSIISRQSKAVCA